MEFNLRQTWHAPDMVFPDGLFIEKDDSGAFVVAPESVLEYMWSPDSYISSSRESHLTTTLRAPSMVQIYKNKTIIFKVRMYTRVACSSNFQWYPQDVQTCALTIESYKYHENIVQYHWSSPKINCPVTIHARRQFQYRLRMPVQYDNGNVARGGRGSKTSFVRVNFTFERKLGNNIIQVYTPTLLVVVLSWFSFFLGLDAVPGRISLLVTCMLTLVTMHSGIKSTIPPVDYITMMDVWVVCCMAFVFTAVCEFVVVKYLHWRQQIKQKVIDARERQETTERLYNIMEGKWNRPDSNISSGIATKSPSMSSNENLVVKYNKQLPYLPWYTGPLTGPGSPNYEIIRSIMVDTVCPVDSTQDTEDDRARKEEITVVENSKVPIWIKIDKRCRLAFPCMFVIFNVIYWPLLMLGGEVEQEDYI